MKIIVLCAFLATALTAVVPDPDDFMGIEKNAGIGLRKEENSNIAEIMGFFNDVVDLVKKIAPNIAEVVEVAPEIAVFLRGAVDTLKATDKEKCEAIVRNLILIFQPDETKGEQDFLNISFELNFLYITDVVFAPNMHLNNPFQRVIPHKFDITRLGASDESFESNGNLQSDEKRRQ